MTHTADTESLVRYIVTSLVDNPEAVSVVRRDDKDGILFEVVVHADDVGKVIGRQGRMIKAIRTLARAAGSMDDERIDVEVLG